MFNFAWVYIWLILPLPILLWWLLPSSNTTPAAVKLHFYNQLAAIGSSSEKNRSRSHMVLLSLAWVLLIMATARPQWVGEPISVPVSGRDLMLAVDVSGSMKMDDMQYEGSTENRLSAVKRVASEFIERRLGDRIGLILFGTRAYLQAPLTLDRKTVNALLKESQIGIAGEKTAIGDSIGLAIKRLNVQNDKAIKQNDAQPATDKILLLLTDGANTAGEITPLDAARFAANENFKIYTIGIGAEQMLVQDFFGQRRINPSADLDEDTLKQIAEQTGGQYFRAHDTDSLEHIYTLIDQLEPVDREQKNLRPVDELFFWPLSLALLCAVLLFILMHDLPINLALRRQLHNRNA